ncbi:MAG: formyltetrahydrofolate deformylase [Actinomycetota bacterium]|jgi:formyltetrahydrofolate deformylase|nr:formyltetrahydrofolate deformylase [Actinomycetota bacterium]
MDETTERRGPTARLLLSAPDRPGLVAAVAEFIYRHGGDVTAADQHTDEEEAMFFQRVEFRLDGFGLSRPELEEAFAQVAVPLDMTWAVRYSDEPRRVAVLVSRQPHCLVDLLGRWYAHELPGQPVLVASNHSDHAGLATSFGLPYHHLPVTKDTRLAQEGQLLELLSGAGVELVVLARYMQILSPQVIDAYPSKVINIHHSFLPAFSGGQPYHQAHARGVKLIGATAHYATAELDQGPIIEQDTARATHRDGVADLARIGRDLETVVLARAVRLHLTDRVLVHGRKTVVF